MVPVNLNCFHDNETICSPETSSIIFGLDMHDYETLAIQICRSSKSSNKSMPRAVMISIRNHNIADDHYNVALEPLNCRTKTGEYICIFESLNTSVHISMKHSRDPHLNVTRHATLIHSSLQIVPSHNLVPLL